MYPIDLSGKTGIIFGVANQRSIAWSIAEILHGAGARVALAYQNERVRGNVEALTGSWDDALLIECDASEDSNVIAAFERVGMMAVPGSTLAAARIASAGERLAMLAGDSSRCGSAAGTGG